MTEAQRKEVELEEFYAHQQKAMDKRLEMVFRQINGAKPTKDAKDASTRTPAMPLFSMNENQGGLKHTIHPHEIEECLLHTCKMSAKQVASCWRGPADLPVKPLDQVPYIEDMIWEVDETGDGVVSLDEFKRCYERAAVDRTGFEPRKLTTLVDFLLMDEENLGFVTQDQITELMTARYGAWRCSRLSPSCVFLSLMHCQACAL
jgi:hypothetical protein